MSNQTPEELLRKLARAGRHTPGCTIIISWGDAGCDCGADSEMHHLTEEVRELVGDLQDAEHDFRRAIEYTDCEPCKQGVVPVLTKRMVGPFPQKDGTVIPAGEVEEWIHPGFSYPDGEVDKERDGIQCWAHKFHEERMKSTQAAADAGR